MKIGLSVKINVSKIDKARLFKGEKGTYLDLTTFIDLDEKDQYGNNGFISQSVTKDERDKGVQTEILGNCKVFYQDHPGSVAPPVQQPVQDATLQQNGGFNDFDEDIPF